MKILRIGSRESRLAVVQAELVRDLLAAALPDWRFEIKTYKTSGDKILDRPLELVGGKGLFTKELELALAAGEVDLLVHSFKDVPMQVDARIPIVGVTSREDERDALVLPRGAAGLDPEKPLGCSSRRRALQLKTLFPHMRVEGVRGNVLTRLDKLDRGDFAALVLAHAGLKRLGLSERVSRLFAVEEILPAACQGILALQARADFDRELLRGVHDPDTWAVSLAERAFVRALDGGCTAPTSAHGVLTGERLRLKGLYLPEGAEEPLFAALEGPAAEAERLGTRLAEKIKNGGTDA